MKYRRLKTDADHSFVLRYYKLKDAVAYTNAIYEIDDNGEATKVSGTPTGGLVGFSHGGDNLAKGMILLDINDQAIYMALLEEGDTQPAIGEIVNGCQKVVYTHYDTDAMNDDGFGVETMDTPYYLFKLVQPAGDSNTVDDSEAGEISGTGPDAEPVTP